MHLSVKGSEVQKSTKPELIKVLYLFSHKKGFSLENKSKSLAQSFKTGLDFCFEC